MIEILQGETLSFALDGEENGFADYKVRVALYPTLQHTFRRDCSCGEAILVWEDVDIVDGNAVWVLTTEQSKGLAVNKYAMEIALHDIESGEEIKESTASIIEVKQSFTR